MFRIWIFVAANYRTGNSLCNDIYDDGGKYVKNWSFVIHIVKQKMAAVQQPEYLNHMTRALIKYSRQRNPPLMAMRGALYDADVNHVLTKTKYTPLIEAVIHGHSSAVQLLIENGANVNYTTPKNMNALGYAVQHLMMQVTGLLTPTIIDDDLQKIRILLQNASFRTSDDQVNTNYSFSAFQTWLMEQRILHPENTLMKKVVELVQPS